MVSERSILVSTPCGKFFNALYFPLIRLNGLLKMSHKNHRYVSVLLYCYYVFSVLQTNIYKYIMHTYAYHLSRVAFRISEYKKKNKKKGCYKYNLIPAISQLSQLNRRKTYQMRKENRHR